MLFRAAFAAGLLALAACGSEGVDGQNAVAEPQATTPAADIAVASMDAGRVAQMRAGDMVRLDLGAVGGVVTARTLSVEQLEGGRVAWTGAVVTPDAPEGEASLVINGASVTGSVRTGAGATYRITPSANGNLVEATSHEAMRPD